MSSLWEVWLATATRHATKPVIIDAATGRTWTCAELTEAAERLVVRGKVAPISEPNGAQWFIRFLASQRVGAVALPLEPALPATARRSTVRRVATIRAKNVSCIKLTSGTTGDLTPIPCSAANLIADGRQICATMGIKPSDRNLALIPLGHSYGLGNLVMPLLLQATPVVCASAFVPREILQLIERHGVTVFPSVPAVFRALAQLNGVTKPASLRLVISAGAPLSADVARQFHERYVLKIHNFYGASETGGICYDRTGNASLTGRSVGNPMNDVTVQIRKDRRVIVRSRAVTGTGRHVLPDLGEWNRYGELKLLGRVGLVANIGGKKVFPAEVETCLRNIPGVSDAWVTVLKTPRGDDYLAAAVESYLARAEIERVLTERLPTWKFPKKYFTHGTLPRTERGKLDIPSLQARLLDATMD